MTTEVWDFVFSDADGAVTTASIKTYGRAVHTFVSRTGEYSLKKLRHDGLFLPGWQRMDFTFNEYNRKHPCGLKFVDHCVGNVEEGRMNHWVDWYENVLEFKMFKHFLSKLVLKLFSYLLSWKG